MSRRKLLVAAGVVAFLGFAIAMVPAKQLARRLPPGIALAGVGGTIWSGRASAVQVNGKALGALTWSCGPWRLLLLEWSCHVTLRPEGGELAADLGGNFSGDLEASDVAGRVPIAAFEGISAPPGWTGLVELAIERVRIVNQRPADAAGQVIVRGLKAPGPGGQVLGDFQLTVGEGSVGTDTLTGRLADLGGPLRVRAALEVKQDGSYLMNGEAAPGPGAGPAIFDTLDFLGPADELGRRPFTIEGTL